MLDQLTPRQLAKREQILTGAMRVFLELGYAGTSMDRVAAEAGVSKQTIYSHFADKEGLFKALIEQATIDRFHTLFDLNSLHPKPEIVLRRVANIYFTQVVDDPNYLPLMRIIISESERFPALARLYTRVVVQRGRQLLSDYFASHPDLKFDDPEAIAQIFFGSLVSLVIVQNMLHGEEFMPLSRDRLIDSLIGLIVDRR